MVLVLLVIAGLHNHYRNPDGPNRTASQEHHQVEIVTERPAAKSAAEREEERAERDLQAQEQMAKWAFWLFWATIVGVMLLAATLRETWKAGKSAAEILSETKRQADIAADTAERQLRAYLSMKPKLLGEFYAGGKVYVQFFPRNHGKTPAYGIRHEVGVVILPANLPKEFQYPQTLFIVHTGNTIYPDSEERAWFNLGSLTQTELDDIASNKVRYHCYGRTYYRDIFGKDRYVDFCVSVGGREVIEAQAGYRDGHKNLPEWNWVYERGHNGGI